MANMIPDVRFPALTWVNLYVLTGLPAGTALLITSKLPGAEVLLWEGPDAPTGAAVTDGYPIPQFSPARILSGAVAAWAYWNNTTAGTNALARLCVQRWVE